MNCATSDILCGATVIVCMSDRKWTPDYVKTVFPAEIRELRRKDGKNPDVKPTHEWLRDNGFIGIQNFADRKNKTVDDVLLDDCGFESRKQKPLPGTHAETKQLVHKWLQDEDKEFKELNSTSIANAWTHMRRLMEIAGDAFGSNNLLRPARASPGKNVRLTLALFRAMNDELASEGARQNYGTTLSKFYEYLLLLGEVKSNPAKKALQKMNWTYNRTQPERALTPKQVRMCWAETEPVNGDSINEFSTKTMRKVMEEKVLFLLLAGCGARTSDPLIINAQEDIIFSPDDPRICFDDDRKNGPGTVPIMAGLDYFDRYVGLLDEEGQEMMFPSEVSEDGTRSDAWVRSKISTIVDRAGVRLHDDSKPTPKHFRQFWYNEYSRAYDAYISKMEYIAKEQSSASAEIVNKHYMAGHQQRDHFRQFAKSHFETAFPADIVISPEDISRLRQETDDGDDQSSLEDFVGSWLPGMATIWKSTQILKEWIRQEKTAIETNDGTSLPSRGKAAVGVAIISIISIMIGVIIASQSGELFIDTDSIPPGILIGFALYPVWKSHMFSGFDKSRGSNTT